MRFAWWVHAFRLLRHGCPSFALEEQLANDFFMLGFGRATPITIVECEHGRPSLHRIENGAREPRVAGPVSTAMLSFRRHGFMAGNGYSRCYSRNGQ